MRVGAVVALVGGAFLFQTTVAGFLRIRGVAPDVLLAMVVSLGLLFGPQAGMVAGAAAGLLLDVASGRYVGLHVLTLGTAGALVGLVERRVYKDNPLLPLAGGLAATLLDEGLTYLVLTFFGWRVPPLAALRDVLVPSALYNAAVTWLVYFPIYRRYHYLRPDPRGAILFFRRR